MARGRQINQFMRRTIIADNKAGRSIREIAEQFNVPRSTIQSIVNTYEKFGVDSLKCRIGRPSVVNDHDIGVLRALMEEHPGEPSTEMSQRWNAAIRKKTSTKTCLRQMKKIRARNIVLKVISYNRKEKRVELFGLVLGLLNSHCSSYTYLQSCRKPL